MFNYVNRRGSYYSRYLFPYIDEGVIIPDVYLRKEMRELIFPMFITVLDEGVIIPDVYLRK